MICMFIGIASLWWPRCTNSRGVISTSWWLALARNSSLKINNCNDLSSSRCNLKDYPAVSSHQRSNVEGHQNLVSASNFLVLDTQSSPKKLPMASVRECWHRLGKDFLWEMGSVLECAHDAHDAHSVRVSNFCTAARLGMGEQTFLSAS